MATQYILIDDSTEEHFIFASEEELEEFLEDREYDEDTLEDVRVYRVDKEYEVEANSSFELKEV